MKTRKTIRWIAAAGCHGPPPARPADAFWEDFRARAALAPQIEAAPARSLPRSAAGWAVAGAAAALIVALAVRPPSTRAVSPAILSLTAGGGDRPVFILRDDRTAAVILWIDAADAPAAGVEG